MPTVIVLHRFGGVTQRILHNHLTECLGAGYDPHSGQINLSKSLYGLLRVGLSTNYVVLQGKDSSYLVLRMADPALHIPQAANKSHDKMNAMNFLSLLLSTLMAFQSASKFNGVAISALVPTNLEQEFDEDALTDLLTVVQTDLGRLKKYKYVNTIRKEKNF